MPHDTAKTHTYGNKGNRWWVGMNIGETGSNRTIFGTPSLGALNPFSPSGYESLPSGNATDDALFAKAAKANKGSKHPGNVSVENIIWYNIQGPYASQVKANAAIPAIEKANPAPGVIGQVAKDNKGNVIGDAASAAQSALDASSLISALGNPNTWLRLVKIAVGSIILIVGLAKITGIDQQSEILKKAVKAAPLL